MLITAIEERKKSMSALFIDGEYAVSIDTVTLISSGKKVGSEISDEERIVDNTEEMTVPEDMFFMMGDNRDRSNDSRLSVGFVPKENLVGKAKFIFFSHNDKGSLIKPWTWFDAIRWRRFFMGIE